MLSDSNLVKRVRTVLDAIVGEPKTDGEAVSRIAVLLNKEPS